MVNIEELAFETTKTINMDDLATKYFNTKPKKRLKQPSTAKLERTVAGLKAVVSGMVMPKLSKTQYASLRKESSELADMSARTNRRSRRRIADRINNFIDRKIASGELTTENRAIMYDLAYNSIYAAYKVVTRENIKQPAKLAKASVISYAVSKKKARVLQAICDELFPTI